MTLIVAPASLLGVIAAPLLTRALDKKRTMMTVFTLSIFAGVIPVSLRLLGLLPPNGSPVIPVVLTADVFVATALGISGFVIVGSMIADVVEDSAVKTGVRSEGLLFAANGLLPKFTTGIGVLAGNMMLEFVHFPAAAQGGRISVDPTPSGAAVAADRGGAEDWSRFAHRSRANLEYAAAATVTEPPMELVGGPPPLPTARDRFSRECVD